MPGRLFIAKPDELVVRKHLQNAALFNRIHVVFKKKNVFLHPKISDYFSNVHMIISNENYPVPIGLIDLRGTDFSVVKDICFVQ